MSDENTNTTEGGAHRSYLEVEGEFHRQYALCSSLTSLLECVEGAMMEPPEGTITNAAAAASDAARKMESLFEEMTDLYLGLRRLVKEAEKAAASELEQHEAESKIDAIMGKGAGARIIKKMREARNPEETRQAA